MIFFKVFINKFMTALYTFRTFLYISKKLTHYSFEIVTVRLSYYKFCARWVQKQLAGAHKSQWMAWALTFSSDTTKMAMDFSVISCEQQVIKPVFHLGMLKPKSCQCSGCTRFHQANRKGLNKLCRLEKWWIEIIFGERKEFWRCNSCKKRTKYLQKCIAKH